MFIINVIGILTIFFHAENKAIGTCIFFLRATLKPVTLSRLFCPTDETADLRPAATCCIQSVAVHLAERRTAIQR